MSNFQKGGKYALQRILDDGFVDAGDFKDPEHSRPALRYKNSSKGVEIVGESRKGDVVFVREVYSLSAVEDLQEKADDCGGLEFVRRLNLDGVVLDDA